MHMTELGRVAVHVNADVAVVVIVVASAVVDVTASVVVDVNAVVNFRVCECGRPCLSSWP